ncbi:MAG: HU family DNA-binding protein [Firmicutes bacterium]|nr:HU family DNA-binding protein [Bacillota bacterium]MCM1476673.1 HU family DNA-binding protein [Bacteroides sp.]
MNTKIPVSQLALIVAEKSGISRNEALQFIKDMFTVVEEAVSKGEVVTIDGIGTFKKSTMQGEPIAYTPDAELAGSLNEAFAMFTPTELNEEVTEEALNNVDNETDTHEQAEPESEPEPETVIESETTVIETVVSEDVTHEEEVVHLAETKTDESDISDNSDNSDESVMSDRSDNSGDYEDKANHEPEAELVKENIEEQPSDDATTSAKIDEDDVEYVVVKHRKRLFWPGMILGLTIGFALGVIAFLAYLVHILQIPVENIITY